MPGTDSPAPARENPDEDEPLGKVQVVVHTPGPEPRILLLQRPVERDSIWQPVTGKIDAADASPAVAARRELAEETGIARVQALEDLEHVFRFRKGARAVAEHLFRAQVAAPCPVVLSGEHVRSEWLDAAAALGRLSWETNREGLEEVLRRIRGKSSRPGRVSPR